MEELLPDNSASLVAAYSGAGQMCKSQGHFDPVPHNSDHRGTGHVDIYIEIRKGDLVMLFSEDESGWAHGSVRGDVGWFPREVVDACEETSCDASNDSMSNISAESQSNSVGWISCSRPRDCFAPETILYKHIRLPNLDYELVSAFSLRIGDKLQTAVHDTSTTVTRKTERENRAVLNIHVDGAAMRVTPSHRIVVPSTDGGDQEVFAQQLNKGDLVMGGDGSTKTITEKKCLPDPSLVFKTTFHPDVPAPAYFPPAVLPILSKGLGRRLSARRNRCPRIMPCPLFYKTNQHDGARRPRPDTSSCSGTRGKDT